jgi:uncharacterized delta-60 repeat protein
MSGIHTFIGGLIISIGTAAAALAATGDLDISFGTNGIAITTVPGSTFAAFPDVAVQPDGKVVISFSANSASSGFDMILARYNPNGSLDTTFSGDGIVTSPFASGDFDQVKAVALQPDGKILVAGGVGSSFAVVRFNPDGSLDTSFDGDGIVVTSLFSSGNFRAISVQADGKIVAAGSVLNSSNQDFFAVVRYNANGSLDTSFGTSGSTTADFGVIDFFTDLTIQPDGKILALGTGNVSSSTPSVAIMRLNSNGSFDNSFDGDGRVASQLPTLEEANSIDLQADGRIVVGGKINASFGVFRFNSNGSLDTTFDGDGIAIADFGIDSGARDIRVARDGKIVGVGDSFTNGGGGYDLAVARFNSNGSLDQSFGSGGKVTTPVSGGEEYLGRLVIQADGRIVGVGISGATGSQKATLARYFGDPRKRSDFDGDGKTDISVFRPSDGYWYIDQSTAGFTAIHWGLEGDWLATGDYDGDNKADTAIFRPSPVAGQADFYILNSNGFIYTAISWGSPGDIPVASDYDADGRDDTAVFRPSDGIWYVFTASGNTIFTQWGSNSDTPVAGDFDGDGRADHAVFQSGHWFILKSSGGTVFTAFGLSADKPVAADYDGDGRQDIAVFRPSDGNWYALNSSNGAFSAVHWGQFGDVPAPGDYDGDGRYDQAVYRGGTWYLNRSSAGFGAAVFGLSTDIPTNTGYPVSPSR